MATTQPQQPPTLEALRALHARERDLAQTKHDLIARARQERHSWSEIGAALGISKQAAWQAYNEAITEILDQAAARSGLGEDEAMQLAREELAALRRERRKRRS